MQEVQIDSVAHDNKRHRKNTAFGKRHPGDQYKGDVALRDLQGILAAFDANGCAVYLFLDSRFALRVTHPRRIASASQL